MCGRKYDGDGAARERAYAIDRRNEASEFRKTLRLIHELMDKHSPAPSNDIRPTNEHLVVLNDAGAMKPVVMAWGFKPDWSNMLLFNSRRDKLDGRVWGKAFRERRCVIPVAGFYEWTGPKTSRQPHAISHTSGALMLLAGLWVEHEGKQCYSIITTEPSPFMAKLHDREPVILNEEDVGTYLMATEAPVSLIRPVADGTLVEFACQPLAKDKAPVPLGEPAPQAPAKAAAGDLFGETPPSTAQGSSPAKKRGRRRS